MTDNSNSTPTKPQSTKQHHHNEETCTQTTNHYNIDNYSKDSPTRSPEEQTTTEPVSGAVTQESTELERKLMGMTVVGVVKGLEHMVLRTGMIPSQRTYRKTPSWMNPLEQGSVGWALSWVRLWEATVRMDKSD